MSNITCAKLASLFFVVNALHQAVRLKELGFVGSMIIASVFCATALILEEMKKK